MKPGKMIATKLQKENEARVAEEFLSSLSDLTCNSKPLINMLTMLAEENIEYASVIVKVVEQHIAKVPPEFTLPILYLIDSIVKNVKGTYIQLFSNSIVNIFCGAFEKVNEKVRERMYALRQTWNEVFSAIKMYHLDIKVKRIDANWPVTAKQPAPSIHVNPNFLKGGTVNPTDMEEILQVKTRELLELRKRKLELELEATKKHLEQQPTALAIMPAEDTIPPIEAIMPKPCAPQPGAPVMIPPAMPARMLAPPPPHLMHPVPPGMNMNPRAGGMYQQNFRHQRPQPHFAPPGTMPPQQGYMPMNNLAKPKVAPVNPALINTVRHRDPRLARQQKQLNQHQMQAVKAEREPSIPHVPSATRVVVDPRIEDKPPPSRVVSEETGSDSRSSTRFSSNYSRSNRGPSSRDKGRDRKRSGSRSSSTERKKGSSYTSSRASSRDKQSSSSKCDKDAFEIAPLSTLKRKSSSPPSSPTKSRDSKRSSKSRSNYPRSKNRSRSRSPARNDAPKDVDLRKMVPAAPEKRPKHSESDHEKEDHKQSRDAKDSKDKNAKKVPSPPAISPMMDVDLRKIFPTPSKAAPVVLQDESCAKKSITSSPKVSFKIQKLLSKLEKSTENLSTASTAPKTANDKPIEKSALSKTPVENAETSAKQVALAGVASEGDGKKRPLMTIPETEEVEPPLAKKSKSAKLDTLFGSEDVDLRKAVLPPIMEVVAPPPPSITDDENARSWDSAKGPRSPRPNDDKTSAKKSTLDDVRAKLAKATKYNKVRRFEKSNKELSQRFKLAELNANEDSIEANDEKIRTIITQAQELLESQSINQEQYRNLVQTVMSINESNKQKQAKRRESLNSSKESNDCDEEDKNAQSERSLRRDSVLSKRIPKLSKDQISPNGAKTIQAVNDNNNEESSLYENKNISSGAAALAPKSRSSKDKARSKPSKWGDRVDMTPNSDFAVVPSRGWMPSGAVKRGGGFRGSVPHPPMPPPPHPSLRLPWQMGPAIPQPPFGNPAPLIRGSVPPPPQPPSALPPAVPTPSIPKPCNSIDNPQAALVRTITIDGLSKDIRIYDDKIAIVFMDHDKPHEISFQPGQRSIMINNEEPIKLQFNDDYKPFTIAGQLHRLRFGFPSRELYIDDQWYEIYFGGPAITIPINNSVYILKAEGPPPQVNIGPIRRDLVVGKINMIVDTHTIIPLFLDAKLQTFRIGDAEHTIQFADNLLTIMLDGQPIQVDYGGMPKIFVIGDKKYFIRFSTLPTGVEAGKVVIKNMIYVKTEPKPIEEIPAKSPETPAHSTVESVDKEPEPEPLTTTEEYPEIKTDAEPVEKESTTTTANGATTATAPIIPPNVLNNINLDELLQQLVDNGILNAPTKSVPKLIPIDLSKTQSIKTPQIAVVQALFVGMQCSSCGLRFPPEETLKYSQHLDWHFRQNRRERDTSRKSHSRKWYYDFANWLQYEEIEDIDEREKNFFEPEADVDTNDDNSNNPSLESPKISCAAGPDDVDRQCDMCQELFSQFYNEELDEWHLLNALRVDDKIYHPLCYKDYKASLIAPELSKSDEDKPELDALNSDDNAMNVVIKIEGDENSDVDIAEVDDDDDVIVLPNEEPSVTEIVDDDDEEYVPELVTRTEMGTSSQDVPQGTMNETAESDVEIQEPHIPFEDLDTYEEKELPGMDEATQMSLLNVKIKEEPKDDDEDDDGFEDVGTVLITPEDEISINSSEGAPTQSVATSRLGSPTSEETAPAQPSDSPKPAADTAEAVSEPKDGDLEPESEHNLSTAGPPAVPLTNFVNKIKINITKSSSSSHSSSSAPTSSATVNSNSLGNNVSSSAIPTVSTIPVLCGGETISTPCVAEVASIDSSISNISVIGSYGSASSSRYQQLQKPVKRQPTPPPPIEETIKYDLKPSLQNVPLKKVEKVNCGVETSGLCSIM